MHAYGVTTTTAIPASALLVAAGLCVGLSPSPMSSAPPPVASLLTACKGFCDDLSTELIQPVYANMNDIGVEKKMDGSHFSLADGMVQVYLLHCCAKPCFHVIIAHLVE